MADQAFSLTIVGAAEVKKRMTKAAQASNKKTGEAMGLTARNVVDLAKSYAPVAFGRLKRSIKAQPVQGADGKSKTITVAIGVFDPPANRYAAFVEFGTGRRGARSRLRGQAREARKALGYKYGKKSGMRARPYLFPAFEIATQQLPDSLYQKFQEIKVER